MSKQPPPAPTARAVGPCPTLIQTTRTPEHWKFTQDHLTTRPPPSKYTRYNYLIAAKDTCTADIYDAVGGGRVVRWCSVNFQYLGVLLIWIKVGQGPTALTVGAGGGFLDIFSLVCHFFFLSHCLWETARYRLIYCLKGPLSPKPANQRCCPVYYRT